MTRFKSNAWLNRFAIRLAMRKPAPAQIPVTGYERLQSRDYYVVFLGDEDERERYLVKQYKDAHLEGLWFAKGCKDSEPKEIKTDDLRRYSIQITHYFKEIEHTSYRPLFFIFLYFLCYPRIVLIKERLSQFLFNHRTLIRSDRMKVLNIVLQETIANKEFLINSVDLMVKVHGVRSMSHPRYEQLSCYYDILLDSLEESGDLDRPPVSGPVVMLVH